MAGHDNDDFPEEAAKLTIVPMAREDLERVIAIERESFPSTWRPDAYERELLNPNARYLVARVGDQVVGFAGMWAIMDEAHITTLAVASQYRRQGIGERLLVGLLEAAEDMGVTMVTLEVRESNRPARALYDKYGFEPVAYMPGYYADTGEDALVMWLRPLRFAPPTASGGEPAGAEE